MNPEEFMNDLFKACDSSYQTRDYNRIEMVCRKAEYEETLDKMWATYMSSPAQIVEYNKQVAVIKDYGCKVFRNSKGKHKIVLM